MKRPIIVTHLFLALTSSLLALSLITFAFAQTKPAAKTQAKPAAPATQTPSERQLISLQFLRLKPGMAPEWREFRKNETLPMLQKAGVKEQSVWSTAIFGAGNSYVIVTPIESLAQYDGQSPAVRALGQAGAAAYSAKAARFTESSHAVAIETRPDLSLLPKPGAQANLAVVGSTITTQGYGAEYESFIKTQILPLIKKAAPKGYLVSQVAYGGNLNQYDVVTLLGSFAELAKFREALGKEIAAAKLTGRGVGIVSRENAIYRFIPELSLMPAPQKAENK